MALKRALLGLLAAGVGFLLLAVPDILGIATWKWVLGLAGFALYSTNRRRLSDGR